MALFPSEMLVSDNILWMFRLTLCEHSVLKPGGWLQFCELYLNVQSDNGSITPQHAVYQLNELFKQALDKNRDRHAPRNMERMMRDAGLVELESKVINIPLNEWPTGE